MNRCLTMKTTKAEILIMMMILIPDQWNMTKGNFLTHTNIHKFKIYNMIFLHVTS